ncbi:disulfide bond formation protein B [Streptomyces sp. NPDC001922]|uniref:disulfide bond formation protein B n=1 Tax=Streptomyces sp. NPDC001922 TaxID=3364624 RepID=UPI0036A3A3E7
MHDMTVLRFSTPAPSVSRLTNLWGLWFTHVYVLLATALLAGALAHEFAAAQPPTALGALQRLFLALAALGPASVVAVARHRPVTTGDFATGWGMSVLASVCGAATAGRQVLLHIKPGAPGQGAVLGGLHLYTWTFLVFVAATVAAGVMLVLTDETEPLDNRGPVLTLCTLGLLGLVLAANVVTVFALQGFRFALPEIPAGYELLHQLGIR